MTTRDERGVVFDLDGVLIDSEPLHLRAYQDVLAVHGVTLPDAVYYSTYLVYSDREVLERLLPDPRHTDEAVTAKARRYLELVAAGTPAFADGLALLAQTGGWRVGLATGSLRREAELALRSLGIRDRFRAVVSIEDCSRGKPDPEPYRRAAAALGLSPADCIAVEDAPGGIQAAKAAGMRCVAVTHTCPASRLAAADLVVDDLRGVDLGSLLPGRSTA
jgi:HAD superfamily hydrolase (TIGR01509 family)